MKNRKKIDTVTNAWVKNKQDIVSGKLDVNLMMNTLKSLSSDNHDVTFREKGVRIKDEAGLDKIAQGFELSVPMGIKEAIFLQRCLNTSGNQFGFSNKVSFEKNSNDKATLTLRPTGDYLAQVMKNPRFAVLQDKKSYAIYSLLRASIKAVAVNAAYQFDPNSKYAPMSADKEHPRFNRVNDFIMLTSRTYIPNHPDIDNYIAERLTGKDIENIRELFYDGLERPSKIKNAREIAQREAQKNTHTEPSPPANDTSRAMKLK